MPLGKVPKWGASVLRVGAAKLRLGSRLQLPHGGKPVYLGRGVRLMVDEGSRMELGRGVYLDDRTRLQVNEGATMVIGEGVYMNTNCRAVAAERIEIGPHTMLGPNVCVFDHDHVFDEEGVHGELKTAPIAIGERCWLGANALVTRGVIISDRILVGGGCIVTHSLLEPGVYAGSPARLVRAVASQGGGLDEEGHARGRAPQGAQQAIPAGDQGPSHEGAQGA